MGICKKYYILEKTIESTDHSIRRKDQGFHVWSKFSAASLYFSKIVQTVSVA